MTAAMSEVNNTCVQARYFALINPIVVKGGNTHVAWNYSQ